MKSLVWAGLWPLLLIGGTDLFAADDTPSQQTAREAALGRRLIDFFDEGYKRGPKVLPEAQRRYETLRGESQNDPRIDYAFGLVHLRQLKNKEAQTQFLLATKRTGEPYWPAWQALIWTHGTAKETTVAYERLTEMAKRLVQIDNAPEDAAVAEQFDWIGQSMAAFEKMTDTPKAREAWLRQDEALRELLGEKLLAAYNSGQDEVHTRHALLEDDIRSTRDKTLEKREQERVDQQTKTEKDLEKHCAPAIRGHMKNLLECIDTRAKPVADIEEGYISTASCILANLSMKLGRELTWDAVGQKIAGDEEANKLLKRAYRGPWEHPAITPP